MARSVTSYWWNGEFNWSDTGVLRSTLGPNLGVPGSTLTRIVGQVQFQYFGNSTAALTARIRAVMTLRGPSLPGIAATDLTAAGVNVRWQYTAMPTAPLRSNPDHSDHGAVHHVDVDVHGQRDADGVSPVMYWTDFTPVVTGTKRIAWMLRMFVLDP